MSGKAMSLKANIRNLAKKKNLSAQVVLQNYMFERFLERLSKSAFCGKFILKFLDKHILAGAGKERIPGTDCS